MGKAKILIAAAVLIVSSFLFTGCGNKILYGTWQYQETIDAKTGETETSMFSSMLVFTINKDGTVELFDEVFGTYEIKRNEFTFTYTVDDDSKEEAEVVNGAYEIIGTDLYIYPDDVAEIYHLAAVISTEEDTTE